MNRTTMHTAISLINSVESDDRIFRMHVWEDISEHAVNEIIHRIDDTLTLASGEAAGDEYLGEDMETVSAVRNAAIYLQDEARETQEYIRVPGVLRNSMIASMVEALEFFQVGEPNIFEVSGRALQALREKHGIDFPAVRWTYSTGPIVLKMPGSNLYIAMAPEDTTLS